MTTREFAIILHDKNLQQIEWAKAFTLPEKQEMLFFQFENTPNLEIGDTVEVRIVIDREAEVKFWTKVDGIVPPLKQPPTQDGFKSHSEQLGKYMIPTIIQELEREYFLGKAQKWEWVVYLRKD